MLLPPHRMWSIVIVMLIMNTKYMAQEFFKVYCLLWRGHFCHFGYTYFPWSSYSYDNNVHFEFQERIKQSQPIRSFKRRDPELLVVVLESLLF